MPGMRLTFKCPCGFARNHVMVGATEDGYYYEVLICLECKTLFSMRSSASQGHRKKVCRKCRKEPIAVTHRGAWAPSSLQEKLPDIEPWMIEGQIADFPQLANDDFVDLQNRKRALTTKR